MVEKTKDIEQPKKEPEKGPNPNNKTNIINDETEETKRDKKDFIIFDDYRRRLKRVEPGRLKINEDKNGEKYASIEIKKGDCPEMDEENGDIKTERNELWLDKECDFEFNKGFKYKFSFKIPENFPLSPTRLVIGQRKYNKIEDSNENEDPSPILAQRIKKIDGKYYFIITDGTEKKNILGKKIPLEDIKGKRIDMDYEINFSDKKRPDGNDATPSTLKVKAKIEGGKEINIYDGKFNLEEMNNLVLDPKESHTGYFKFGLYRDSYNYTIRKIRDKNDIKEIEQAKEAEKKQPTKIYFKNFSMEKLNTNLEEIEKQKDIQKEKAAQLTKELINEPQGQQVKNETNLDELEKENVKTEKDEKKYIEYMIKNSNIEGIIKYIGFNDKGIIDQALPLKTKDFLNYNTKKEIDALGPIKDISKNSIFQANSDEIEIIKETKEGYGTIHEKLTNIKKGSDSIIDEKLLHSINTLFEELKLLEKNNVAGKGYEKVKFEEIINNIILVKNEIKEQDVKGKLKKIEKYIKKIKEYERGEYINFPNGINFELKKGPIEEGNIKIGENEYYIRTHIETDKGDKKTKYIEYVATLKKAREFFKKNNIDIKYCRRCTRLANRKFIEAYEEKRKIRKGKDYKKSNRLKVLEQTEKAVVFEEIQNDDKPPIRFIDENKDRNLLDFIKGEGKELFHESIMWLDLDKLSELQQTLDEGESGANKKDEAVVQERKKETRNETKPEKTIQNSNEKKKKRKFFRKIKIKIKKLFGKFKKIFKRK